LNFILKNYILSACIACGGSLTAVTGIIKSPGYPNPRTKAR